MLGKQCLGFTARRLCIDYELLRREYYDKFDFQHTKF